MPLTRDTVFDRVYVDYAVQANARVSWLLRPRFPDNPPYEFQLQVSRNGGVDWLDVGAPLINEYYAIDDSQRLRGQDRRLTYRVVLTTADGTYTSPEADIMAKLTARQWLLAKSIIRRLKVESRGLETYPGVLLKRRIAGTRCTACTDRLTGGITDPDCQTCKGSGFIDGYFRGVEATLLDLSPQGRETHNRGGIGTITEPKAFPGKFVGVPLVHNNDIWVDTNNDQRYRVGKVQHMAELNMLPLVCSCELYPIEYSDIAYQVPLEGM